VDINIQVLQADGGVRAAAINAAVLAIADAGIPLRDTLAACTAGYLDGTPLLDLNYLEARARRAHRPSPIQEPSLEAHTLNLEPQTPKPRPVNLNSKLQTVNSEPFCIQYPKP
jgi:hypothetical protein